MLTEQKAWSQILAALAIAGNEAAEVEALKWTGNNMLLYKGGEDFSMKLQLRNGY